MSARAGRVAWRTQDCLAISADGAAWYMVNASPDIRTQILAAPELVPGPGRRDTPLRGVLLTSAELDHTLGVASLREGALVVHGTATVLDALLIREAIRPYGGLRWEPFASGAPVALEGGLSVEAVPVGRKRPRYASGLPDAPDWVVALRFTDARTGGVLVYAPGLGEWAAGFAAALDGADCLLLDGSFYTDDEMVRQTGGGSTARQMGHLPIVESLAYRPEYPRARWLYTHLNNTNPVLVEDSDERRHVVASGAGIADDGMLLEL
jgi:pyrroloquinoline quinone biosynthesis protein B